MTKNTACTTFIFTETVSINFTTNRSTELKSISGPGPSKNGRRHGKKLQTGVTGNSGGKSTTYLGRDKTPDISATPVDREGLTHSQKIQLEKFKEMKKTTGSVDGKKADYVL